MDILSQALATVIESDDDCIFRNRNLYVLDWAAWHGLSENDMQRVLRGVSRGSGGKAALLARFPLPEEAKHLTTTEGAQ